MSSDVIENHVCPVEACDTTYDEFWGGKEATPLYPSTGTCIGNSRKLLSEEFVFSVLMAIPGN
jgi:hypothetical protein